MFDKKFSNLDTKQRKISLISLISKTVINGSSETHLRIKS